MNIKTIIYYGNTCYPDKDASAHRTIGNAKVLRELGYNVILIGCRKGEQRPFMESHEEYEGFSIFSYPCPVAASQWRDYLFHFKPLEIAIDKFGADAVILYNHPAISSKRILSFCHKRGIKVYADCTEWFDPKGCSLHTLIKRADTWYRMVRVNMRLDGVIAISSFLQKYYDERGCKTICVPPLIDLICAKWAKVENTNDERVKLIYVGNPGAGSKDKIGLIISALKQIRQSNTETLFQLDVVGMTEAQFVDAFDIELNDCDFVQFHGRKPNSEALDMIKRSDFSIFLRDTNLVCTAGFPTKFSESIACGTPVLTNLTSDLGRYMKDGNNGYIIDTTSFEATCKTMCRALSTPKEKIIEMKNYCRNDKSFDYHSFIDEFKKMF